MMKNFFKEPLLHFLLLSFLLFIAFDFLNPEETESKVVEISAGRVAQLQQRFQKISQRPPSVEETEALVRNYALDEIYNREARALGLDKNDSVVKKRMRQKMEFMLQDTIPQQAEQDELEALFRQNKDKYRIESRFSFEQAYVSLDRDQTELAGLVEQLKTVAASGEKPIGDDSLIPATVNSASESEIARKFGQKFLTELLALKQNNSWQGPFQSGLGLHFVKFNSIEKGLLPALDTVHDKVLNDWKYQKSNEARQKFENELLERYDVQVEAAQ